MKKESTGFSLVEILVAVAIITVIMGIAIASTQGSRRVARDSQRKLELEEVRSALEMYRIDEGTYPDDVGDLVSEGYLDAEALTDPLDGDYAYGYVRSGDTYELCAYLETQSASTGHCASANGGIQCGVDTAVACNYEVNQP